MSRTQRIILGIDPGLAHTGWGVVSQDGPRLACVAYGCVTTSAADALSRRLLKVHDQIGAVVRRFRPTCVGIETVWFGTNVTAAFGTGQARGAALVACAEGGLEVGEFSPSQIKLAIVGTGAAVNVQFQFLVGLLLQHSRGLRPCRRALRPGGRGSRRGRRCRQAAGGRPAGKRGGTVMIAFLRGALAAKSAQGVVVDVGGVGYGVALSQASLSRLPGLGEEVSILTYLQVSESGIALYGFLSEEEKALFERLIAVSGVGPKVALAALSTFSAGALADAIASQDVALVQKIPGVGKKTAQRIILELKGSLDQGIEGLFGRSEDPAAIIDERLKGATEALLSMGFTSAEAELALKGAPEGATEAALLQYALKRLGS